MEFDSASSPSRGYRELSQRFRGAVDTPGALGDDLRFGEKTDNIKKPSELQTNVI